MDIRVFDEFEAPSPKKRKLNAMVTQPSVAEPEDDDMEDLYADTVPPTVSLDGSSAKDHIVPTLPPSGTATDSSFTLPGLGAGGTEPPASSRDEMPPNGGDAMEVESTMRAPSEQQEDGSNSMAENLLEKTTDENDGDGKQRTEVGSGSAGLGNGTNEAEDFTSHSVVEKSMEVKESDSDSTTQIESSNAERLEGGSDVIIEQDPAHAVGLDKMSNGQENQTTVGILAVEDRPANTEAEWEEDSSPYESSSDDSSDSSSDDDSDDSDDYVMMDPAEQARRLMEGDGASDDEGGKKGNVKGGFLKTHNEQLEEVVEKPDLELKSDTKIEELGHVETTIDNLALIKAKTTGEYQVLESGSLLCLEDKKIIGVVSETLGRVQEPLYCVRFSNAKAMEDEGVSRGVTVYYVPEHSTFVFTKALQGIKGSDASNVHDEEIGVEEMEFSDDEAEAEYRRNIKLEKQAKRAGVTVEELSKSKGKNSKRRGIQDTQVAQYSAEGINYDDPVEDDGELYTPLARPTDVREMMSKGGPSAEYPKERVGFSRPPGGGRGRGDRAKSDRGRSDRGPAGRGRNDRRESGKAQHTRKELDLSLPPTPKFPGVPSIPRPGAQSLPLPSSPSFPMYAHQQPPSPYTPSSLYSPGQFQFQSPQSSYGSASGQYPSGQWSQSQPASPAFPISPQAQSHQYQQFQGQQQAGGQYQQVTPQFQAGSFVNPAFFTQFQQPQGQGYQGQGQGQGQVQGHQGTR